MSRRDDFPSRIRDLLARRVGFRCSNPACRRHTSGPRTDPERVVDIGVAAHITGAAPGGPRYDPTLSPDERKSISNGVWLCQNCAKLVDNDEERYTADVLRQWRKQAEHLAQSEIENTSLPPAMPPIFSRVCGPIRYTIHALDKGDPLRSFRVGAGGHTAPLRFDVTNPNTLDLRIVRFFVDVIEFVNIDIVGVFTGDAGAGVPFRRFTCKIKPRPGRYECAQASEGFDYIRLSSGEMEAVLINITAHIEGVYRLMLAMEYSIGGEASVAELNTDIQEIAFFDRSGYRVYNVSGEFWEDN